MKRLVLMCLVLSGCLRPSEDNVRLDETVGTATTPSVSVDTLGQAAVSIVEQRVVLWAAAPTLSIRIESTQDVELRINNVLPGAALLAGSEVVSRRSGVSDTQANFTVPARLSGQELILIADDAHQSTPFSVVVLSDIQEAFDGFPEIVDRINEEEGIRFVLSTGDLTRRGETDEYIGFQEELERLSVPFYTTVGNHEVPGSQAWHELFGPFNVFFEFKGVAITLLDSSTATVDPEAKLRFDDFAAIHLDDPHMFLTHVPLLDPSGIRTGSFRNRHEGIALAADLNRANIDAMFFGHIHSFYTFSLAGVPGFISGGGGALPERLDGIGRHYLKVLIDPTGNPSLRDVSVVRVD